jgi:hypothetical protein
MNAKKRRQNEQQFGGWTDLPEGGRSRRGGMLTRDAVAQKIIAYLHHRIKLTDMVDWAKQAMMPEDFEEEHFAVIRDVVSRLSIADVLAFGLTWEDLEDFLARLGYEVRVEVLEIA